MDQKKPERPDPGSGDQDPPSADRDAGEDRPRELGGRKGPEPTRFGDWEKAGRCIDF